MVCLTNTRPKSDQKAPQYAYDVLETRSGIEESYLDVIDLVFSPLWVLRKCLESRPENLKKLAWRFRRQYPDMRMDIGDNRRVWIVLLRLDSELCNEIIDQDIQDIETEIQDFESQLYETDKKNLEFFSKVNSLPKFVNNEIARLAGLNLSKVRKSAEELSEDYGYDYPTPHETYGRSFTDLNAYRFWLVKQINKFKTKSQTLARFCDMASHTIGDIIELHSKNGSLSIVSGDENAVKDATDRQIYMQRISWLEQTREKDVLTRDDIEQGFRAVSRTSTARKLRSIGRMGQVDLASALGLVSAKSGSICHPMVAHHKIQMEQKSKKWAQSVIVKPENKTTEGCDLWTIIESQRKQNLASLYAITDGYEQEGDAENLTCLFGTITLPPDFHPAPKSHNSRKNEQWDYSRNNAEKTAEALSECWNLFRANLKKVQDFRGMFGIKVIEFHEDGCPHLHFMLWLPASFEKRNRRAKTAEVCDTFQHVESILRRLCPAQNSKGEYVGYDLKNIEKTDEDSASPASYVMEYIIKCLTIVDPDEMDSDDESVRHKAQLSAMRMRGFSFIGSRGIRSIWNRLHKSTDEEAETFPTIWKEIRTPIQTAKSLWHDAMSEDNSEVAEQMKQASREHARHALRLLNAFPHAKQSYEIKTSHEDALNRYMGLTRKPKSFDIIDQDGEVFSIPYKAQSVVLEPMCDETERDTTGLRNQKKRNEILSVFNEIAEHLTFVDVRKLQGIYGEKLDEIHYFCIYKNELVSLNQSYPRAEASPQLMDEMNEIPRHCWYALEALRSLSG